MRILLYFTLVFVLGCSDSTSYQYEKKPKIEKHRIGDIKSSRKKYLLGYNSMRDSLGIPKIKEEWKYYRTRDNGREITFSSMVKVKEGYPDHVSKSLVFGEGDELLLEIDRFYSGKNPVCSTFDPDFPENVPELFTLKYDYYREDFFNFPWSQESTCCPTCDSIFDSIYHYSEIVPKVNTILEKWGLENRIGRQDTLE